MQARPALGPPEGVQSEAARMDRHSGAAEADQQRLLVAVEATLSIMLDHLRFEERRR